MVLSLWSRKQKILLFSLPLLLTFLFGMFGSDYADQGFVRGFSWRLRWGELPYVDFVYPRPPLTIYLDAFFKIISPAFLEVFNERLRFYYQMLAIVLLVFWKFEFKEERHGRLLLLSAYFFTLGCFPPMPWYTTDGLLFGALSFYFVDSKDWKFGLSLFFAFCSALAKQSFYPVPLFLMLYYFYNIRQFGLKPLLIGILPLASFFLFLSQIGGIDEFLLQTSGASKPADIWKSGFALYLRSTTFRYLTFVGIAYYLFRKKPIWSFIFLGLALGFEYFKFIWITISIPQSNPAKDWPRAIFAISFLYLLFKIRKPRMFPYWFLLCVAWSSSLSWGYQTPILFIAGLVLIIYLAVDEFAPTFFRYKTLEVFLVCSVALFFLQNLNRHFQGRIWYTTYHLGKLDKKYTLIFTNSRTFDIFKAMKKLGADSKSTFLPAFSDADYFLHKKPFLPLNWVSDLEVRGEEKKLRAKLESCHERIFLYPGDYNPKPYSLIADFFEKESRNTLIFKEYCF